MRIRDYLIANRLVRSELRLPAAELTGKALNRAHVHIRVETVPEPTASSETVFSDTIGLGDLRLEINCTSADGTTVIRTSSHGTFAVAADGLEIRASSPTTTDAVSFTTVLLGPALTLALARLGVVCLHSSSVSLGGRASLFLGESGSGKSTLARYLAESLSPEVQRVADDIVPVELGPHGAAVLPHFPQLKLPPEQQWAATDPSSLEWVRAFFIDEGTDVKVQPIRPHAGTAMLLRHVVALPLFDPTLRQSVLEMCAAFATRVPMAILSYPRRFEVLPDVARALEGGPGRDLSAPVGK